MIQFDNRFISVKKVIIVLAFKSYPLEILASFRINAISGIIFNLSVLMYFGECSHIF